MKSHPSPDRYDELIAREARHWDVTADLDPDNPQLWGDPRLFELALARPYRHLIARVVASGGPVLELGCGDGQLACDLARAGLQVTGIDLSGERLSRARQRASAQGLEHQVRFESGDLNVVSMPHGAYATVVAHDALHHILALDHVLDRVQEALVPGGRLIVSDFIGSGMLEKLTCSAVVALLPTRQSYRTKWRLRGRATALIASERGKREALERGGAELHDASPFEGISQESILPHIAARFEVVEYFTFCPFWYHVLPKLRLPRALCEGLLATFRRIDEPLNRRGITRGSYCFIEARRR